MFGSHGSKCGWRLDVGLNLRPFLMLHNRRVTYRGDWKAEHYCFLAFLPDDPYSGNPALLGGVTESSGICGICGIRTSVETSLGGTRKRHSSLLNGDMNTKSE